MSKHRAAVHLRIGIVLEGPQSPLKQTGSALNSDEMGPLPSVCEDAEFG
jgi:hypothetical protein